MALDYDGSDDNNDYGTASQSLGGTGSFSASVWVQLQTDSGWRSIFGKGDDRTGSGSDWFHFFRNGSNSRLSVQGHWNGSTDALNLNLATTALRHLAMTWDGTTFRGYDNGSEIRTSTPTGAKENDTDTEVLVGCGFNPAHTKVEFTDAIISEPAIWDGVVLDAPQVLALSKGFSAAFFPDGLVFYDKLVRDARDIVGVLVPTVTGAVASSHPAIIYPTQPISGFAAAAVDNAAQNKRRSALTPLSWLCLPPVPDGVID